MVPPPRGPPPRRPLAHWLDTTQRVGDDTQDKGHRVTLALMTASMAELEARIAALEAERGDYRAVLAAINALGANQRDLTTRVGEVESRLGTVEATAQDTNIRVRSLEDGMAEMKDLLVRALDR